MRLSTRMFLFIISTSVLVFIAGIGYISLNYKTKAMKDARNIALTNARSYANLIKSYMDKDFGNSRGMADAMVAIEDLSRENAVNLQYATLKNMLESNPAYIASFLQWDLSDCDTSYKKDHGRRRYLAFRRYPQPDTSRLLQNKHYGPIDTLYGLVDTLHYDPQNPYYVVKNQHCEYIINPYFYSYQDVKEMPSDVPTQEDAILETTIIIPIVTDGKFRALTGVDIPLNHFQNIINEIHPFEKSFAVMVSNNGAFVAHPDKNLLVKPFSDFIDEKYLPSDYMEKFMIGEEFSFTIEPEGKGEMLCIFSPIQMGNTCTPWSIGIFVPTEVIMADANRHFYISLLVGGLGLVLLSLIIFFISRSITNPIRRTTRMLKDIAAGKIDSSERIQVKKKDEIGEMTHSVNKLIEGLNHTTNFAEKIGEGNLETDYQLLSNEDKMGHALIEMRDNLKHSREEINKQNQELEKLSMVAQKTDNAVTIMDALGNIEWVNEAFTKMYGYSLYEIKRDFGDNIAQLSSHQHIERILENCIKGYKTIFYDSMIQSKSGKKIYAQTTITPVLDEFGNVLKLVAIDSDITGIKQAQEEIEIQRDELETLNATKDKFFAIIAHDLKNPFTSLLSLSESLSESFESLDKEEMQEFLKRVNKSAWQIFNLLENLLTWARSQTGKIEFNPEFCNLKELINSTTYLLKEPCEKKKINLTLDCANDIRAYIDKNMVSTVFRNLIHNAIKFTPENGQINVEVTIRELNNKQEILCLVKDSGIGMSQEDMEKLFRIDVKTKSIGSSKEKGTGLGLILCKEFVEKNGGEIWVESKENESTSFSFTLPLNETC